MAINPNQKLPNERKQAFQLLWDEKLLGEYETISGNGATLMNTAFLRRGLEALLAAGGIRSVLDIGCGDGNWACMVNWHGASYHGVDIVGDAPYFDILETVPEAHDLVICHDLFTHFSHTETLTALRNIKASGSRLIAVTNYEPAHMRSKQREEAQKRLNQDAPAGYWRPVYFQKSPFSWCAPLLSIEENEPGKTLDIWRLRDIPTDRLYNLAEHNPITRADFDSYGFFRALCALPYIQKIALFGSRARGDNRPDSDIDLMIFCDKSTTQTQWLAVCDIIRHADIPLGVDAMRYDAKTLQTIPGGYFKDASIYRTLYERPHSS